MPMSAITERPSLATHILRYGQDWGAPHSANNLVTPYSAVSLYVRPVLTVRV